MSALPFISHHLFASAIRDTAAVEKPAGETGRISQAADVPLELLDWTKPLPDGLAKTMRGTLPATNT